MNKGSVHSAIVLARVTVTKGFSSGNGGGIYNTKSSLTITEVTFSNNSAYKGAGIYIDTPGGTTNNAIYSSLNLTKVTFSNNAVGYGNGGGIYSNYSSLNLTKVTFSNNSADRGGGMNINNSTLVLTEGTFSNNSADRGGGLYHYGGRVKINVLTEVTFSNNVADTSGGGVYNDQGSFLTLTKGNFSNNVANNRGGGIYNTDASLSLTETTLSNNSAKNNKGKGGGLFITEGYGRYVVISRGTFFGNTAGEDGGGIFKAGSGASPVIISSTILWNNTKGSTNTLNQFSKESESNTFVSHSIIQGATPDTSKGILATSPNLGTLATNGGFAKTMAIESDSPAKDKGLYFALGAVKGYFSSDNTTWYTTPLLTGTPVNLPGNAVKHNTDARGYSNSGRPDIGAYEYGGTAP